MNNLHSYSSSILTTLTCMPYSNRTFFFRVVVAVVYVVFWCIWAIWSTTFAKCDRFSSFSSSDILAFLMKWHIPCFTAWQCTRARVEQREKNYRKFTANEVNTKYKWENMDTCNVCLDRLFIYFIVIAWLAFELHGTTKCSRWCRLKGVTFEFKSLNWNLCDIFSSFKMRSHRTNIFCCG